MKHHGSAGIGSRRRYLAEQDAFMAEQWPEEFGKGVKSREFQTGSPYERYSAESARRRSAVASGALQATSAVTGAAAVTGATGRHLGHPYAQSALKTTARTHPNPGIRDAARAAQKRGKLMAKHPGKTTAAVLGLGATSAATGALARFRRSEQEGISQGIGRIKAGESYTRRQEHLSKGLLSYAGRTAARNAAVQFAASDPATAQVLHLALRHKKAAGVLVGGSAATATTGGGVTAVRRRVKQRKQLVDMVHKSATGMSKDVLVWAGAGGTRARVSRKLPDALSRKARGTLAGRRAAGWVEDPLTRPGTPGKVQGASRQAHILRSGIKMQAPGAVGAPRSIATTRGLLAPKVRRWQPLEKAYEPLKTSISEDDAKRLVARHGLKGPLPKTLGREERMGAYEARYVASGGRKGEKWQRRANMGDKVKTAGLAGATAAGAAYLGGKTKAAAPVARVIARKFPGTRKITAHHLGDAGVAAATIGGAGELYAGRARHKRASYASAPGGVAASALRRMRAYDEKG